MKIESRCYECDKEASYLFPDGRCSLCTRMDENGSVVEEGDEGGE